LGSRRATRTHPRKTEDRLAHQDDWPRRSSRSAGNRPNGRSGGQGLVAAWQDFTGKVQALSARMPVARRQRAQARAVRATRRIADDEWEQAERAQEMGFAPLETPFPPVPDAPGALGNELGTGLAGNPDLGLSDSALDEAILPGKKRARKKNAAAAAGAPGVRVPLLQRQISYKVLVILTVASLLVGCIGTSSILHAFDALSAARDAKAQVALIEATLKGGAVTEPANLDLVKTHLEILGDDLNRLQADVPLGVIPGMAGVGHLLTMGQDLVQAGVYGIDAAVVVVPALKEALHGVGGTTTSGQASGAPLAPTITLAQAQQAQQNVDTATSYVRQALVERQGVSNADLERIGLGSFVPTLAKLDALTPQLQKGLDLAHTAMGALPSLLGLSKPVNYLLFNQDSDELRATGGFNGNYAVITVAGGRITSGVHLHDIISLDCPYGNCYNRPNPPAIADWFFTNHNYITNTTQFGVRDSNFDPDFPTTAKLEEQLAQQEGVPPVSAVVAITPGLMESILQLTGPVKVPDFNKTVDASNLQDSIHYFHILAGICQGNPNYQHCGELYAAGSASQYNTSQRKVFDAVLGGDVLHAVASLQGKQQSDLLKIISTALKTKDLQVYFNDPQMEALLAQLKDSSTVAPSQGDMVFPIDTNVGATYVNGDIQETISDTVTLDSKGNATHDMAIHYNFPVVNHTWSSMYSMWTLRDVLRIIVPKGAQLSSMYGCSPVNTSEAGHDVWACAFILGRPNSTTVHITWTASKAATSTNGATQYTLVYQKQAGSHSTLNVTIIPPKGATLKSAGAPLKTGSPAPRVTYSGPLTEDTTFQISYTG